MNQSITNRYKIYANICMGEDVFKYTSFVVHANSPEDARKRISGDWNIDRVRKMDRKEVA